MAQAQLNDPLDFIEEVTCGFMKQDHLILMKPAAAMSSFLSPVVRGRPARLGGRPLLDLFLDLLLDLPASLPHSLNWYPQRIWN